MNKLISTKNRVFMSMVGPSESGKTQLIYEWLTNGTFQPKFDKIYSFYQYYQSLYDKMQKEIDCIEFVKRVNFELIDSLKNNGTKYLLIFDDSCEEVCSSKEFVKIATAGRHRGLSTIYTKHNLFHKSTLGRDIELQTTHIALFKSPRDVMQINTLSIQLGLGSSLVDWYRDATSVPFGHLLIDLSPRTDDRLRYCTNSGKTPSRNQLIVAADNFTKEENLPYINVVGLSRDIDEQLKHVHKVIEIAEGTKRKVCVTLLRCKEDNPETSYAQIRLFTRRTEEENFQQLVYVNYKIDELI